MQSDRLARKRLALRNRTGTKRGIRNAEAETHLLIGNRLRCYYQDIVQQPVPERFNCLLRELEKKLASEKPR